MPAERPALLASVASAEEALAALRLRIAIVDLKDPRAGPLGACPEGVWRATAALRDRTAPQVMLSAALGEVRSSREATKAARRAALAAGLGFDFVKIALVRAADADQAEAALAAVVAAARAVAGRAIRVIAVTYAEAGSRGALPPRDLPMAAARGGADGCLLDTATKDGRSLTDHLSLDEVAGFIDEAHGRSLVAALAGSLATGHLRHLVPLRPDVIGVRGALCREGREGHLDPGRLIQFDDALCSARRAQARAVIPPLSSADAPGPTFASPPWGGESAPPDGR